MELIRAHNFSMIFVPFVVNQKVTIRKVAEATNRKSKTDILGKNLVYDLLQLL